MRSLTITRSSAKRRVRRERHSLRAAGETGFVPPVLPFYFWHRVRQEKSIEQNTDIDWVIVRPAMLTNGFARGNYRHGFNVGNYMWPRRISRADVADFMLEQLNDDTYIGTAPGVCY
jgi:hypothetical protein